ncbi:MAG: type I-E CRISPR-associated protein Cse2/CasB [Acidobacteriota bacterium]|nr:type I-E CRISPR-associated protein Cse2/CasB [Acidobacteriota bacterium]
MIDSPYRSVRRVLKATAAARVAELQSRVLADNSEAVATLARLRRCDPADVGAEPLVWAVTLGDLPDELTSYRTGRSNLPTPAERALHAGLVLYALHQQSRDEGVHRPGVSLGGAVGQLARMRAIDEDLDAATVARLHHAALATSFEGHVHHLRGLIQLMRAEKQTVGLDYGLLAVDLWQLADPYQDTREVLTRWGRDLHARPKTANLTTTEEKK